MALKYYIASESLNIPPSERMKEDLQSLVHDTFTDASSYFTIQEETAVGTGIYKNIDVRVNKLVNSKTGQKISDDFKKLIFEDFTHATTIGQKYKFDNYTWMCLNKDNFKSTTVSNMVRRCNNTLQFYNQYGVLITEECILDYELKDTAFDFNKYLFNVEGDIVAIIQRNTTTSALKINDVFAFRGQTFQLNGINDMSIDNILTLKLFKIAESTIGFTSPNIYNLSIDSNAFESAPLSTGTLTKTLTLNGEISTQPVVWTSSNPTVATINSSTGVYNTLINGTVTFTCKMTNNTAITDTVVLTVVTSPIIIKEARISPNTLEVFKSTPIVYTVYKHSNNIQQADTFTITASGIPTTYYKMVILNGNSFSIESLNSYPSSALTVTCISDVDATSASINLKMKGVW